MKKKLILIILVLFFGLVITGCDKEENGGTNNIKYLYTENGINIRKIEAYLVGGTTPNLSVVFSNTTSEDKELCILPQMANRHGLITGASGTGKTTTVKVLAESFSDAGVPVFVADVKGDLGGCAVPGESSDKIIERLDFSSNEKSFNDSSNSLSILTILLCVNDS